MAGLCRLSKVPNSVESKACKSPPTIPSSNLTLHFAEASRNNSAEAERASQFINFIVNTKSALKTVKHLKLIISPTKGSDKTKAESSRSIGALLGPLALTCPHLHTLSVKGPLESDFLQLIGSNCVKLIRLEACLPLLSQTVLKNLALLMPNLTSLVALPHILLRRQTRANRGTVMDDRRINDSLRMALKGCPGLLSFDAGPFRVSEKVFQSIPESLQHLAGALSFNIRWLTTNSPHTEVLHCTCIRSLDIRRDKYFVDVSQLVPILAACPNLTTIHFHKHCSVHADCSEADAVFLQALDERIGAGLVFTFNPITTPSEELAATCSAVPIVFTSRVNRQRSLPDPTSGQNTSEVITLFEAQMQRPSANLIHLKFRNNDTGAGKSWELSGLSRSFPNMRSLGISDTTLEQGALQSLVYCTSLDCLDLYKVEGFTTSQLRRLCMESKSLRQVCVWECKDITSENGQQITEELNKGRSRQRGIHVFVFQHAHARG